MIAALGSLVAACGSVQPTQMYQAPVYTTPKQVEKECGWKENRTNDGYCVGAEAAFFIDAIGALNYGSATVTDEGNFQQITGFACGMDSGRDSRSQRSCSWARNESDPNRDKTVTSQEAKRKLSDLIAEMTPSKPFYFEEEQIMQDEVYSERTTRISEDKVRKAIGEYKNTAKAALSACNTLVRDLPDSRCICPISLENCNLFSKGKEALAAEYSQIPTGRRNEVRELHDKLEPLLDRAESLLERDLKLKCGYELDCGDLQ